MRFFKNLLQWFQNNGSLDELEQIFFFFIKQVHISHKDLESAMGIKGESRGGFTKNILLKYVLISEKEQMLIEKFLLGANNIYDGIVEYNGQLYYKFISEKAIRDKIICKPQLVMHIKEVVNDDIFCELLRNKLFEEAKEMLHATTPMELLEEAGDFLTILQELQKREMDL